MRRHHNYKPNHKKMLKRKTSLQLELKLFQSHSLGYEIFRKVANLLTITSFLFSQVIIPYSPAYAGNITDVPGLTPDGSTNTVTDRAPNNTPIVNIAAPSAGGVSLNNWESYNVTNENQILNNAKGATVDTQLAGQIYGNPNLTQPGVNEAAIIVNQVTSTNRTNINGYVEVAGRKAELIVANPNGLSIAGGGFINVSRLGLVSGSVNMNGSGNIDSFTLGNGQNSNIIITGIDTPTYANLGLDASTVDYVDIITRSVQVLGDIHAKGDLNFRLGNGAYDYANRTINSDSSIGAATKPSFALDSSYLGGMYAGRISLIATENGIGVRTRSDLVSKASEINFDVAGDIDYERLNAETNINLTSTGGKITQGKYATIARPAMVYAKGNITLTGATGIELNDSSQASNFYALGSIYLNSTNGLIKNNSHIKAEGASFDSAKSQSGGLFISSASFENTSLTFSSGDLSITTSGLTKNTSGSIESTKAITVNSGSFSNSSLIKAGADASFIIAGSFTDTNQIKAAGNLSITATTGISYNDLYSGGNLSLTNNTSGNITQAYKFYSLGTSSIINNATSSGGNIMLGQVGNLNSSSLFSDKTLTLKARGDLTSNVDIFSNGAISIESNNFANNQKLTGNAANLTINTTGAVNNNGALSVKNLNLTAAGLFKNTANLQTSQNLTINQAASFENSSIIQAAGNIALTSLGGFVDSNQIKATGNLSISANTGITYNNLYSGGNLSITNSGNSLNGYSASGDINHNFKSYSIGTTTITNNGGNIIFGLTNNSNSGSLYSKGNLNVTTSSNTGAYVTNNSDIFSEGKINITSTGLTNNMRIMAIGLGAGSNASDLTINLDQNLLNRGLLFASNNINLNVDGTVTNDGISDLNSAALRVGGAEIFALNGNVNINGKLYNTSYGNVSKYDFFTLSFDKSAEIWADLLAKGYIDSNGKITDAFKYLTSASGMNVDPSLSAYKDAIYNTLAALSSHVAQSGSGNNSLDRIAKDFDNKASDIYTTLRNSGYIDASGKVTQQFYTDTKTGGANALIFKDANGNPLSDAEISYLKNDIYQLLEDARNGKVIENTFLGIAGLNSGQVTSGSNQGASLSSTLITELKAKGYIDADGNVTSTFTSLGSADALAANLSSDFTPYKQAIFDQINAAKSVNKASESNFSGITYQPINSINNSSLLYSQLLSDGYIDSNGNILNSNVTSAAFLDSYKSSITSIFNTKFSNGQAAEADFNSITYVPTNPINSASSLVTQLTSDGYLDASGNIQNKFYTDGISSSGTYADYKTSLDTIFNSKASKRSVQQSDFSSVAYQPINNINDATALVNQLKTEGFIDDKGNITEKFYTDGIASSTSSLTNYQSSINSIIGGITQATLADSSFRKITKSLDNSAARLVGELIDAGYLDSNGNKTANFNFADETAFATAFTSVATGGEFETARAAILNKLNSQSDTYSFTDSDFLGGSFDSNILFNENRILMTNLINNGYLSSDGEVKQSFYSLSGNYTNLNLDSRFSGLKGQIGSLIAQVAPSGATITSNNLVNAASGSTRDKAGQIFDKMVAKGYFNAKGDFTQKLMDEVVNHSGTDAQKTAQLQLDEFSDYASGVFQQVKSRNGTTSIKNYATKVENINGGKITSSLGDINIKAITVNNVAKDNKDVVSNPENGVARTPYRGIGWAWQNTVLWGYDTVSSILDSNQSFLQAGHNLSIEADNVWNNSSVITAGNNLDLRLTNLNNTRTQFTTSVPYIYETHWKRCKRFRGCNSGRYQSWSWNTVLLRSNTPSVISSGNSLNIAALNDVRLDTPTVNTSLNGSNPGQGSSNPNSPTSSSATIALNPNQPTSTTWQITIPTSNNGLFKKAAPDSQYLIESAYNTNDPNRLTGSAYYKSRFGFDPNQNNIKWLGDPFWEWNAVNQQILQITKKQQNWNEWALNNGITSGSNWQENINKLIDNAYSQKTALDLIPGVKLTEAQINALNQDIIWYEEETIMLADGSTQKVAVPRIYLTKDSFFNSDFGTNSVIAGKNININAGRNIDSNGTVISSLEKTNLNAVGDISIKNDYYLLPDPTKSVDPISSFALKAASQISTLGIKDDAGAARSSATFNAGTDLKINSGGSINIANNYFQTGGSIFMTAANDINNSNYTIKAGNNVVMDATNINNIHTSTGNGGAETRIEAGNMASLNASNNITNIGGTIRGGNLLYMTAGGDITNKALVDYRINGQSATEADALSSNANRITSSLISQGSLESGGNLVLVAGNNLNNIGSKITATGSAYMEATNGDINITTSVLRDREVTSGGKKRNSWTKTVDNTTNVASEISVGGDLETLSGKATSIIGSKVNVTGDLTANVGTNLIIANAVNSSLNSTESTKRGSVKTVKSFSSDYVETALESDVKANNIALNVGTSGSGGTLLIQGSKMDSIKAADGSGGNTTSNAKNTIITDAILQESHYSHKATSSRGIARVGTAITSTVGGLVGGYLHYVSNIIKPIDDGAFRGWVDNKFMDNQFINIKHKTFETKSSTHSQASDVTAGNNITITSAKSSCIIGTSGCGYDGYYADGDTTIQASNISATNDLTLNAENLNILTRSETNVNTSEDKVTRALSFTNYNEGSINTSKIIDSALNANSLVFNVANKANVEVSDKTDQSSLPYLIALKNQTSPESLVIASKSDFSKEWHDNVRGTTDVANVGIVAAAVAIAFGTGGIGSGLSGAMLTATATTAGTTATISGTNASMNSDGSIWNQTKTISDTAYKDTTSDESIKNMAIAAAVAGAAYGVSEWINNTKVNYNNSITPEQAANGKTAVSTGHSNLMPGSFENSKIGVNVVSADGSWYIEGTKIKVPQNYAYTAGNQNPVFKALNITPGAPSFADFHDALDLASPWNELSIPPAYAASQFNALAPYYPIFIKYETNKK